MKRKSTDSDFKFVRSSSVPTDEHTHGKSRAIENLLQDDLQILKDTSAPKTPVIAHLNLNSLKNKINGRRILIQDIRSYLSETKPDKSFPTA